ncbi:MAG: cadherin-like domain-containing protein [Candidatus Thiodiazotropha taylori]|nr:cadherin-like domain-containing protein [Candidatus Thiodiazotropha taylori]
MSDGFITFEPSLNYNGADSFNFTLSDGQASLASDTFVITVNEPAVAVDDNFTALPEEIVIGNVLSDNGLGADTGAVGATLSVTPDTITSSYGTFSILANGDFTYTPFLEVIGTESFDYTLTDGFGGSDTGTVNITIDVPTGDIAGTSGDDSLNGSTSADGIWGLAGDDTLDGLSGDDRLYGGSGADTLYGKSKSDNLYGGSGNDYLYGGSGADSLYGGDGDDVLYGGNSVDTMEGGAGADLFVLESAYAHHIDVITDFNLAEGDNIDLSEFLTAYNSQMDQITDFVQITDDGIDSTLAVDVNGGADNFVTIATLLGVTDLSVDPNGDLISVIPVTEAINDNFTAIPEEIVIGNVLSDNGLGADTGAEGATLSVTANTITESYGTFSVLANGDFTYTPLLEDYIGTASFDYTLTDGLGGSYTGTVIIAIDVPSGDVVGTPTDDSLNGSSSADGLWGLAGDDTINSYSGNDVAYGGSGADTIYGQSGADSLYGGSGNDYLYGGSSTDSLYGGDGDDVLYGGNSVDTMEGGAGADRFVLESAYAHHIDVITDFNLAEDDALDISDLLSAYDPLADAITDFVEMTDDGVDSTLAVDADGGADGFVTIATLTGVTGLTDEAALEASGNLIAA